MFVIARERGPILLGNAACQWLGLIAVLIENKVPIVGRFVAAVTREETEGRGVEAYPLPKTGDSAEITESRPQSQKAITAPKKKRIQTKKAKPVAPASEPLDIILGQLTASLSHLHLRELNQIARNSKTRSFQEVYHMQNLVLSARERENREQKIVLSGMQIALKYHEESTTGQWLMLRLTEWMARDSSNASKTPVMWPGLAHWKSCLCAERSQYSITCRC